MTKLSAEHSLSTPEARDEDWAETWATFNTHLSLSPEQVLSNSLEQVWGIEGGKVYIPYER